MKRMTKKEFNQISKTMDIIESSKEGKKARAQVDKTGKPVTFKKNGVEFTFF